MNLKKRLRHLSEKSLAARQYGKTESIIKICKDLDGVLICADTPMATDITRKHGIVAKSMDVNLEGLHGPFFFDHTAIAKLLKRAADKIEEQEEKEAHYDKLKAENEDLQERLAQATLGLHEQGLKGF